MAAGAGLNTASGTCIATAVDIIVDIIVGAVVVALPLILLPFLILLVLGVRAVLRFLSFRNPSFFLFFLFSSKPLAFFPGFYQPARPSQGSAMNSGCSSRLVKVALCGSEGPASIQRDFGKKKLLKWINFNAENYRNRTSGPYTGLADIDYPFHDKIIVVTRCGRICLGKRKINFSQVFAGQAVGIKEVHDDIWLVSFMDCDLGYFDLETRVLEPLENPFGPKVLPMS